MNATGATGKCHGFCHTGVLANFLSAGAISKVRKGAIDVRHRMARLAGALALVCAGCSAGGTPAADDGVEESGSAVHFAPYVNATTPADTETAGTPSAYYVAFAVASGSGECRPMWDDGTAIDDAAVKKRIGALRDSGADVRVSFGGATGTELAVACESTAGLAAAYGQVLEQVGATTADFDIEGKTLENSAASTRRAKAIKLLQHRRPGLKASFTLPVMPTGLTPEGAELLERAAGLDVRISAVNIMAMSYSPSHTGDMGDYAIAAARAAHDQITRLPGMSGTAAWRALMVTVMIGVNDIEAETFTLGDAAQLAAFAAERKLGGLSMWSSARDRECPGGAKAEVDDACSGVTQTKGAFSVALSG
ncbi:chitinase [Streptomyces ovatisporus]|uniref:Chitinase n=1 Tax=Streptomyces ovatisporus TaxID=1128682 RepID=A0ABV9A751_9ACTN